MRAEIQRCRVTVQKENMKPDRCSFCKGRLDEGKTELVAKVGDEVISIKDVPAYVCENCGEAYFTPEISRALSKNLVICHRRERRDHRGFRRFDLLLRFSDASACSAYSAVKLR